jgi:hypothetical protein
MKIETRLDGLIMNEWKFDEFNEGKETKDALVLYVYRWLPKDCGGEEMDAVCWVMQLQWSEEEWTLDTTQWLGEDGWREN